VSGVILSIITWQVSLHVNHNLKKYKNTQLKLSYTSM